MVRFIQTSDLDNKTIRFNDGKIEVLSNNQGGNILSGNIIPTLTAPEGSLYQCVGGANVGAYLWQMIQGKWRVVYGDTGLRTITKAINMQAGAWLKIRRINNQVFLYGGGLYPASSCWGVLGNNEGLKRKTYSIYSNRVDIIPSIPVGFRSDSSHIIQTYDDDFGAIMGSLFVGGPQESNWLGYIFSGTTLPSAGPKKLRLSPCMWTTSNDWPTLDVINSL